MSLHQGLSDDRYYYQGLSMRTHQHMQCQAWKDYSNPYRMSADNMCLFFRSGKRIQAFDTKRNQS